MEEKKRNIRIDQDGTRHAPVPMWQELPTVPIAEKNCITAPRKTLRNGRIISSVPPLVRKAKMYAEHTSSVQWFWKRAC